MSEFASQSRIVNIGDMRYKVNNTSYHKVFDSELDSELDSEQKLFVGVDVVSSPDPTIICGTYNVLADGLAKGEFMTRSPSSIGIERRLPAQAAVIKQFFKNGGAVMALQECDHVLRLLAMINSPDAADAATINCCAMDVRGKEKTNSGLTQLLNRNSNPDESPNNTFENDIRDESDCAEFVNWMNLNKPSKPQIPDFVVDGGFVAGYCTCILWNEKLLTIENPAFDEFNHDNNGRKYCCYLGTGDVGFIQKFRHLSTGKEINVFAGHLKSGEGPDEEAVRVSTLRSILYDMKRLSNPICLLDMNSSSHYRKGISDTVAKAVIETGFTNVVAQDDVPFSHSNRYQCFKMRGADGNQPPKFLEFMFDTIDGILVKKDTQTQLVSVDGVTLYDSSYKHNMYQIRTNPKIRQLISNWGLNWHNEFEDDEQETYKQPDNDGNREIRPTGQTGSNATPIQDKKGTILKMMSSNKSSRWGEDATKNVYDGMSDYIRFYVPSFALTDNELKEIFLQLYPNELMPSDHPPVAAEIRLV